MRERATVYTDVALRTPDERDDALTPPFAEEMAGVWRAGFAAYAGASRYANIASMTGMASDRAGAILAGKTVANRREARTLDAALGTDASALFPAHSGSVVQSDAPSLSSVATRAMAAQRARSNRGQALSESRLARIAKWAQLIAETDKSFEDLATETNFTLPRLRAILKFGARMDANESTKLQRILGRNELLNVQGGTPQSGRSSPSGARSATES